MNKVAEISSTTSSKLICIAYCFMYICINIIVLTIKINVVIKTLFLLFLLFSIIILVCLGRKSGIYLDDNYIYYRYFRKIKVKVKDVIGVKVTKISALGVGGYYRDYKCANGKVAFNMFILKTINPEIENFFGQDETFKRKYKDYIWFCCEYSPRVISALQQCNPNLIILDNITNINNYSYFEKVKHIIGCIIKRD